MKITIQDIVDQAARATNIVAQVRGRMLAPDARKVPPGFTGTQMAALCGLDKNQFNYRVSKGDLPGGSLTATGRRREFSLSEARTWVRAYRAGSLRKPNARAVTIAIGNFKGGVSKTTTAMTLAQGLSLRGHRVLVIDMDPQGSLTTLFGILPDTEVDEDKTFTPLATGDESSIEYAIRQTYWEGIDLVPASSSLFNVEFILPSRQMREPDFEFWNVLNEGIELARSTYDIIIIDTPPALSYGTVNAFMAGDGLILPHPPSALDYASSTQFWSLLSDLSESMKQVAPHLDKIFDFIHVLLAKVDHSQAATHIVREWINKTYE